MTTTNTARAGMQLANRCRRRWRQWWTRLLLLHARQQHTLSIRIIIDGIQWYVLAITMIIVTVALAQTAQLSSGHIITVVYNVIVQRLQIGCGQRAFLLLLAMKRAQLRLLILWMLLLLLVVLLLLVLQLQLHLLLLIQ